MMDQLRQMNRFMKIVGTIGLLASSAAIVHGITFKDIISVIFGIFGVFMFSATLWKIRNNQNIFKRKETKED